MKDNMKRQRDKEIPEIILFVFSIFMACVSIASVFLLAWLFPNYPWKDLTRLTVYGIFSLGVIIYFILTLFREFQKRMIFLQVITGIALLILYYTILAILIRSKILKLPPNTWAYVGVYFIFCLFILYPALRIEYEFLIKRYLIKKKKKSDRAKAGQKRNEEEQKEDASVNNSDP